MYDLIKKDDWEFSADIEKTSEYYKTHSDLCNCDGCKNYYQTIRGYSAKLTAFLEQFGVDIEKPIETEWYIFDRQSKIVDYTAYYAVHGTAAKGSYEIDFGSINVVVQPPKNSPNKEMPEPYFVFQIFNLLLPWVLPGEIKALDDLPKKEKVQQKDKSLKSNKLSFILYLIAALVVLIPIFIVLITGNAFTSSHSRIFVNTAIVLVIVGRTIAVTKKAKNNRYIPWAGIGSITGLLIVLIWNVFR